MICNECHCSGYHRIGCPNGPDESEPISDCCAATIIHGDLCSECLEHCGILEDEKESELDWKDDHREKGDLYEL